MRHAVCLRRARAAEPALVGLHGMLGAPASFAGLAERLAHAGPIWASVLPGHGRPARALPAGGFDAAVTALAADLDEPAFLIGYSLGARLALGLAVRHPERVLGVIAVGAHLGFEAEADRAERRRWDGEQAALLCARGLAAFVDHWQALPLFATQARLPDAALERQRRIRLAHESFALADAFEALGTGSMPPLAGGLARSRVPVVMLAGALDPRFVEQAERARALRSRVDVRVIPGAGHNVLLEAPDALASLVDDQLERWSPRRALETNP